MRATSNAARTGTRISVSRTEYYNVYAARSRACDLFIPISRQTAAIIEVRINNIAKRYDSIEQQLFRNYVEKEKKKTWYMSNAEQNSGRQKAAIVTAL